MLGGLLNWIKVSVLPSLSLLEQIGLERGFNIYELLELAKKPVDFTKKQNRLYNNARQMTDKEIMAYLNEFLGGIVMARTYKKNARNVYILPYYARISVWLIGLALVDGLLIWMNTYLGNATILIAGYLLTALLVVLTAFGGIGWLHGSKITVV